ncbi:MAG: hypothetical protein ACK6DP_12990 [Gemmatimonas sp.]|jgi:hypothetical protein|uniref:hypothetical protein n=1 Tax=Gemmatimonas sp. TaxID=1962908 RepID=UPI00391FC795|nr:hypothetical protein [Gemmatimonadota bacterium]
MRLALRRAALRFVTLAVSLAPVALGAQTVRRIAGFDLAYTAPSGWTLAGTDGRMEAWSRGGGTDGALLVFGGMYSSGQLAIADGSAMLQGAQFKEPATVLEPPALRRVGAVELWTSAVRVQSQTGDVIVLRMLARPAGAEAMLGVVTMATPAADSAYRVAAERLLGSVRGGTPTVDRPATTALAGAWRWQESNVSGTASYVNEEGWDLASDGTFVHWTASTVSLPGAAVEPTRTRQTGRWEVMGGALVVRAPDGVMTVSLRLQGRAAEIAGRRFVRR